jgi:hypothetical protein
MRVALSVGAMAEAVEAKRDYPGGRLTAGLADSTGDTELVADQKWIATDRMFAQ